MRLIKIFTLFFITSCLATVVSAQYFNDSYKFVAYTTMDGLSDNSVNKSIYDSKKYLWVATMNGLNKFNGLNFKKYSFIPGDSTSLRSIWVTDLLLDKNGLLWVSTEWGICYYDEKFDCFRYINEKGKVQIIYKGPLCNGTGNTIWVAAEDGLKKIDVISKKLYATSIKLIPDPQSIVYDSKGFVWIGTRGHGMYLYDVAANSYKQKYFTQLPGDAHIMGFYQDSNAGIYAATSAGLLLISNNKVVQLYNKGMGPLGNTHCDELMCVAGSPFFPGGNNLLCGTYNNRLLIFNTEKKLFTDKLKTATENTNDYPQGVFNNIFCVDKITWISTDHGLYKLNLGVQDIVSNRLPLFYNDSKKILLKKLVADTCKPAVLWAILGKPSGGIIKYDISKNTMQQLAESKVPGNEKSVKIYTDLILDTGKYVWAFEDNSIDRYSVVNNTVKQFSVPRQVLSAVLDNRHNFWIGTISGLLYFNTITGASEIFDYSFIGTPVENTSISDPFPVHAVKDNNNGTVWLTCRKYGLFSFDKAEKKFTAYRQAFSTTYETKNRCNSLVINTDGKIWCGTMAGLTCYNPIQKTFTNYNAGNGLQSTYVYSINCTENNQIWGRGNTGVFSFDIATQSFMNYNLPVDHNRSFFYQQISLVNGKPFLGIEGGYSIFNNTSLYKDSVNKTYITHCKVMDNVFYFDAEKADADPFIFSYKENILRFDFTTIDYNNTETVSFYYKLQGFDKNWIKADAQSFVIYNNLAPGTYVFRVKSGEGSEINDAGADSFSFQIKKPFWLTWPFILLLSGMFAAIVFLIYRYRLKQVKKFYEVRSSISRNLHDEIGATLSSINIYSDVARKNMDAAEVKNILDKIYTASANTMESMSDIVWYVNPQNDAIENAVVRMREYALPLLEAKNIIVLFNVDEQVTVTKLNMQQRQHFYLVFKEAVNNIVKYAGAKNVAVNITQSFNQISMIINDDGKGFDSSTVRYGNGIHNITQRAKQLNGAISVKSTPGTGTCISLQFKIA